MRIAITTSITTLVEIPEGVSIEDVRREITCRLHEEPEDDELEVFREDPAAQIHENHAAAVYIGEVVASSEELKITEVPK